MNGMRNAVSFVARRSVVRFALVGVVSTSVDFVVLNLFFRGFGLIDVQPIGGYVATTAGFLAGMTVGFLLNSRFVFNVDRTARKYAQYATTSAIGLLITLGMISVLYDQAGWRLNAAKLAAVAVVFIWNYTWSRFWIFGKRQA
jgi:putative flippase GtrA